MNFNKKIIFTFFVLVFLSSFFAARQVNAQATAGDCCLYGIEEIEYWEFGARASAIGAQRIEQSKKSKEFCELADTANGCRIPRGEQGKICREGRIERDICVIIVATDNEVCTNEVIEDGDICTVIKEVSANQVSCVTTPACSSILTTDPNFDCSKLDSDVCTRMARCFVNNGQCLPADEDHCRDLPLSKCGTADGNRACAPLAGGCAPVYESALGNRYLDDQGGQLPPCAYAGNCRSVNDIIQTAVNYGKNIFFLIGSLAFLFFIIGGVTILVSFGNSERVKKGQQMLVAAVVGMAISFGAYFIVTFILEALGVATDFNLRNL